MAISREEAIKQIGEWYGGFTELPSEDAIHKAISDMEKLQKIEELAKRPLTPFSAWDSMVLIEQIVKEV